MEFRLPELGEGVYEAELVAWLVHVGDSVRRGQDLMEVMTDKATMEVPAPFAGTISALAAEPGTNIKVGDVVLSYTTAQESAPAAAQTSGNGRAERQEVETAAVVPSSARGMANLTRSHVMAAPSVRYLARKLGIDLTQMQGSGPSGRILLEDLTSRLQHATPASKAAATPVPTAAFGKAGTRIKLQGLRRKIAERMVQSKHTIPHYTYVDEFDVTELVRMRESFRDVYAAAGVKLTYLAFAVKAVVAALKEVPIVNSTLDEKGGEIVVHDHYHVGIAVSTPGGLIVPVIHDADQKDLAQIAREVERLSADARLGKSKLGDLRGGTFTITSIGNVGGLFSTPVINPPEVAILGLGKIVKRPVYDAQGNVKPADMVYLSLSCDHRVLDGAVGAAFASAVGRQLQAPAGLLVPETTGS
jgi:pyruvate dehydrogenase E2 component (dihydrolipoamide acetyltransferase)/2-oxoisovalerate dehydrogenase E2 component (dihydrolipoyl transacylase)